MPKKPTSPAKAAELRRRAEARLREHRSRSHPPQTEADAKRLLHELQVHQIELELQNSELQEARDKVDTLLETYTDLYDFAPVGYFSVDEQGLIIEVNLTGAALLGIARSRLINQRLQSHVDLPSRTGFLAFLKRTFGGSGKQICEVPFVDERGKTFFADVHASPASSLKDTRKWCRMVISDLTALKK